MQYQEITEDEFYSKYKPIKNPLVDDAPYGGEMFETYGAEYEHVMKAHEADPLTVWTISDCDGELIICSGWSFVNRFGYLITQEPAPENTHIEILEDD